MANTTNLTLPLIAGNQDQKHVTHNDALNMVDAIVQLSVKDRDLTAPPGSPSDGDRYIPAAGATSAWSGWDLSIAAYQNGAWVQYTPKEGWICWVDDENLLLIYDGTVWNANGVGDFLADGSVPMTGPLDAGSQDIKNVASINGGPLKAHNAIINGDFDLWQRGTSFTAAGYFADRWSSINNNLISRQSFAAGQTDVLGNPKYFLRMDVSVAGAYQRLKQLIEDVNTFSGQIVTVSFWAKYVTTQPALLRIDLLQEFGSGGSGSVTNIVATFGSSLTTSWQKFTYSMTMPSVSGKTIGSGNSLSFRLVNPTNEIWDVDIAHVSVVEGDATNEIDPFEKLSYGDILAQCQRYYEFIVSAARGNATAAAEYSAGGVNFATTKRVVPSILFKSGSTSNIVVNSAVDTSLYGFRHSISSAGAGDYYAVNHIWAADAEL